MRCFQSDADPLTGEYSHCKVVKADPPVHEMIASPNSSLCIHHICGYVHLHITLTKLDDMRGGVQLRLHHRQLSLLLRFSCGYNSVAIFFWCFQLHNLLFLYLDKVCDHAFANDNRDTPTSRSQALPTPSLYVVPQRTSRSCNNGRVCGCKARNINSA